jgi:glycosyltransferase involved in cell wall biosynthesis|tara:strand:- start:4496 stop:5329 length:834 start_codon:yes stop_codon:yes gene_type:complete
VKFSIAVIIPTYNRCNLIGRAVESVLRQSFPAEEICVVDDGSCDGTQDFIRSTFPEVKYVYQENAGVSSARNRGLVETSAEWVAFLDSDDVWLDKKLEVQRAAFEAAPNFRLIHSDEIWIRNGQRVNPMKKHRKFGGKIFERCLPLCLISPSAVIIERTLFDEVGVFDESLPACEDYDLWLRICCHYPVLYVDKPLLEKHGGHDDQLSKEHWGMDRFRVVALENLLNSSVLNEQQRTLAISAIKEKCLILISGALKRNNLDLAEQFVAVIDAYSFDS